MSVIETITNEYHFWEWLKESSGYKDNFSLEGAKAVFNYFDDLSEQTADPIEFDPVAWCCEFSEYDDPQEAYHELVDDNKEIDNDDDILDYFRENTTLIELDNGHLIIGEF